MPQNAPIIFQFQGFDPNYCPPNYQQLANDFAAGLTGFLPGSYITILTGDTEPGAADRDKPWIRSDGRIWLYSAPGLGEWVSKHPLTPNVVIMGFFESEADIWSFDGGDGQNPTVTTPVDAVGAMWEKVAAFDGRMPIGPGTLSGSGTVIASGDTGGADRITQLAAQLPPHQHILPVYPEGTTAIRATYGSAPAPATGPNAASGSSTLSVYALSDGGPNTTTTTQTPMNTISPYVGVYFIRRTNRLWYTI